ncbi:MAG: nucleotidyltransferase family protein, partial [Gammaproteobacteria bacterium]
MPDELHALGALLGASASARDETLDRLSAGELDLDALIRVAERHSVSAWLYDQFIKTAQDLFDDQTLALFESVCAQHTQADSSRRAALHELIRLLEGAGIRALAFKGPVFAHRAHAAPDLRLRGDQLPGYLLHDTVILVGRRRCARPRQPLLWQRNRRGHLRVHRLPLRCQL